MGQAGNVLVLFEDDSADTDTFSIGFSLYISRRDITSSRIVQQPNQVKSSYLTEALRYDLCEC